MRSSTARAYIPKYVHPVAPKPPTRRKIRKQPVKPASPQPLQQSLADLVVKDMLILGSIILWPALYLLLS